MMLILPSSNAVNTSTEPQNIKLVVMMYHGFTNDSKESEYVINASRLEEDILTSEEVNVAYITLDSLPSYEFKFSKARL